MKARVRGWHILTAHGEPGHLREIRPTFVPALEGTRFFLGPLSDIIGVSYGLGDAEVEG